MSEKSNQFEIDIVNLIKNYNVIPENIPTWMENEGILPGSQITSVERMGNTGSKTDVIIRLESPSKPIKISIKLNSAHHFGNWYSHPRIIEEFGQENFNNLVKDCTLWANDWKNHSNASLFVGVSICFGKRQGKTAREFTQVFNYEDIVKIVAGYGEGEGIANCLFVGSEVPVTIDELLPLIKPIDEEVIMELSDNFKVAYRPINPATERSNRGKAVYTKFQPYKPLEEKRIVKTLEELNKLGEYVEVEPNSLNHNHILRELDEVYNICIPLASR
ncbi:hypothetical protein [Marinilactibacillus kalidii]|uniref:hypothetical protein n=1 Tax=Marinilactibacillus kalidii TaxID=2820274 RepID=UPI001ABDFA01|nr:hypothetical protein [Marinilactibacillus kalidii]